MRRTIPDSRAHRCVLAAAVSLAFACEEEVLQIDIPKDQTAERESTRADGAVRPPDGGASGTPKSESTSDGDRATQPADASTGGCKTFDSSYAAIQELIFERHGCTAAACHGQAKVGGLDLSAGASWESLVDADSSNSKNKRVQPGQPTDSFLYQKVQAATEPGSVQIAGSPMPLGNALSAKELEALRLWIAKGAPKSGTVSEPSKNLDVGSLLDACLPNATPVKIKPLEPPPAEEGFQLVLPAFTLEAGKEIEHCIPFTYDLTSKIPARYKDEARNVIVTNGSRIRQDPQSHHLVIWNPKQDLSTLAADVSSWTCYGGPKQGQTCDPKKGSSECGEGGACGGKPVPGTFCTDEASALVPGGGDVDPLTRIIALLGLLGATGGSMPDQMIGTQTPQQYTPPLDGVYTEIPLRGVFWYNSHAFNLTESDTLLEARVNYFYAKDLKREMKLQTDSSQVSIAEGTPPFTRKTYCAKHVVPRNYEIATLASHTHRRGEHFWVKDTTGKQIYETFDYSDPAYTHFEPWLKFSGSDEASRTLEYCATFNNGLTKDDKPDLSLVTRASKMPERSSCVPIACVAGKVTAACTTDSDCDSTPGKGDGDCDACVIKGGPTTENEMFALLPWYVFPAKE